VDSRILSEKELRDKHLLRLHAQEKAPHFDSRTIRALVFVGLIACPVFIIFAMRFRRKEIVLSSKT
jgi:hypothetical protein